MQQFYQLFSNNIFSVDTDEKIHELAALIRERNLIFCIGTGSSGIIAEYATRKISEMGYLGIRTKEPYDPIIFNNSQNDNPGNLIIAFSISGENSSVFKTVELVKSYSPETKMAVITRESTSSITKLADLVIPYHLTHNLIKGIDVSSHTCMMMVIDYLVYYMNNNPQVNGNERS